jgi:hypothetical protein
VRGGPGGCGGEEQGGDPPDPAVEAGLVFAWLDESGGTVAVCCPPGRIGILDAEEAVAYLPLVRSADARGEVVAATADIAVAAGGLRPAAIRVIADRSSQGDRSAELPDEPPCVWRGSTAGAGEEHGLQRGAGEAMRGDHG